MIRRSWSALSALLAIGLLGACSSDTNGPGDGFAPPPPSGLSTTSLDGAVALVWPDNAYESSPANFQSYAVYSSSYDLDQDACGTSVQLEGTTVAPEFISGALVNGVSRCFFVTAISVDGFESDASVSRNDTPRPDARNVVVFARQEQDAQSGFRFWQDVNGDGQSQNSELGLLASGTDLNADFTVERDLDDVLFLQPVRAGTEVALYGTTPVEDLTSIDIAPNTGFDVTAIEALPGWGYVFEMTASDAFFRYGAVRVTHVGRNFLILDWAFQTDPGNPELLVGRR